MNIIFREKQFWELTLLSFETYDKVTVTTHSIDKVVATDTWNGIQNPKIDPRKSSQLIFDNGIMVISVGKNSTYKK